MSPSSFRAIPFPSAVTYLEIWSFCKVTKDSIGKSVWKTAESEIRLGLRDLVPWLGLAV